MDRRPEAALAVAEVDAHAVGGEDGQVGDAVVIEVGHADDLAGALRRERDGIGEPASAQAREHAERCSSRG